MPIESNFLQLNSTTFAYEGADGNVVSSINWSIPEGGIHCLVGRSG